MIRRGSILRGIAALAAVVSLSPGCYLSPDPRVRAAEDFRSTVFDLIGKDEAQTKRLNSLRLGMTDQEVLAVAGTPARRETRTTSSGRSLETWIYNGELSLLGTLSLENGRLSQIATTGTSPTPAPSEE